MNDPHIWWYITRSSGILAWVILSISVVWGILLSTRVARRIDNPAWLQDLHRYLSGTALVLLGIHMVSLMLDGYAHFSLADLFIPFASSIRPLGVAVGISAMYLLVAVWVSSMFMHRIPRPWWKAIHLSSYAVVVAVAFHSALTGSDVGETWYTVLAGVVIGVVAAASIVRVLVGRPTTRARPATERSPEATPIGQELVVRARRRVATDVLEFEFAHPTGEILPVWWPGDHVSVRLPNGLVRQYSLCGDPANRHSWTIAVKRVPNSRGGSEWITEHLAEGAGLRVTNPVHRFELEPARTYLFVAAGIGITAIRSMVHSMPANREWRLLYLGQSLAEMAFAEELLQAYPERVSVWESILEGGRINLADVDLSAELIYACGPESVLNDLVQRVPAERLRFERFTPIDAAGSADDQAFTAVGARSGTTVAVAANETLLTAMERSGLPVFSSCREGSCGSCEVRVISGTPDHRDQVLDDDAKASLGVMYPCVSRSKSETLVLDV